MDNFGHDVAQKIKSAIKAKLVELDSYVDDELPDYIMVMVANKKPKAQMSEDLSLFLGDSTVKFVEWLHEVLGRLQAVTLDSQRKLEVKPVPLVSDRKQILLADVVSTSERSANDAHSQIQHSTRAKSPTAEAHRSDTGAAPANADPEMQDEMLTIKAETYADDMLADELLEDQTVTTAIVSKKPVAEIYPISPNKILSALSSPLSAPLKLRTAGGLSAARPILPGTEKQPVSSEQYTASLPPVMLQPTSAQSASRKRKAPCSTVGAVVKREFPQEEDDDEYDPRRPKVGSVASIVQVSRRKSSVPPERQASKMLLLKAVDEAQKSILQSAQRNPPARSGAHEHAPELFTKAFLERQKQWQQHQQERRIKPSFEAKIMPPPAAGTLASVHEKREEVEEQEEEEEEEEAEEQTLEVVVEEEAKDEEEGMVVGADPSSPESDVIVVEEPEIDGLDDEGFSDDKTEEPEPPKRHNRHVLMQNRIVERPPSPKFIITLDGVDNNAFMSRINEDQWMESADSFVEGNDLDITLENDDFIQEEMETESTFASGVAGQEEGALDQYQEDFENGNGVDADPLSKKQRLGQTCRYWPSCKNGAKCSFLHPRVRCKTFPNCKFGNQCLYIHPNCKYDATCTRRNCPFTHASRKILKPVPVPVPVSRPVPHPARRPAAVPTLPLPPQKIVCRHIPTCSNVDCQYYHPKPCRYGQGCTRADCVFYHPPLPTPDKLKWNKLAGPKEPREIIPKAQNLRKSNIRDRKFAMDQVQQKLAVPVATLKT